MSKKHTKPIQLESFKPTVSGDGNSVFSRDLENFTMIYHCLSVLKAAEFLGVDQGNLSKSLKKFEEKIGSKLFYRTQKGLVATKEADQLAETYKKMKVIWGESLHIKKASSDYAGVIRIGCHPSVGLAYLGHVVRHLLKAYPDAKLEFKFEYSVEVSRLVSDRQIDIGIVSLMSHSSDLIVKAIDTASIDLVSSDVSSVADKTLLFHPKIVFAKNILKLVKFKEMIEIFDYEIIANLTSQQKNFAAILFSSTYRRYPQLKVIKSLRKSVDIKLLTYPGSPVSSEIKKISPLAV